MALQATPYKVELNLTDLDRGVYELSLIHI